MTDSTIGSGDTAAKLKSLRAQYPDTPFLALGQTVWWDEPMKAVLRRLLDANGLGGRMVMGVHDTDYFAKLKSRQAGQSRFDLVPHNDGATKDLWSAAGEISRLFGSETVPTRQELMRHGVPFDKVVRSRASDQDRLAFINEVTEAWGWRGLVYTGSRDLIVHSLPLQDMGDSLERLLRWGFVGAIDSIADECCKKEARAVADRFITLVADYRAENPSRTLSDLYRSVFPHLMEMLLGHPAENTEITCTAHLLRLAPETAGLPRFEFVDLFLNETTRHIAAEAYNAAVAGSEMYTLDRFGVGALPFDVVLPDRGRGTLRVTLRAIHIETRTPIRIPLKKPINSIHELAEVLSRELGEHVTVVGKAVALISMLAREFIFVFNEEGSGYVTRTRRMNDHLVANGVSLRVHPILRLCYPTWDALEVGLETLKLPTHLAAAFKTTTIESARFAREWQGVVAEQQRLLKQIKLITRPRDLLAYLDSQSPGEWAARRSDYDAAKTGLRAIWARAAAVQEQVNALYEQLAAVKSEIGETERSKGDHYRSVSEWTTEEDETRSRFDETIEGLLEERREILAAIARLKEERLAIERGPDAQPLRLQVEQIEADAELARLHLIRNALLTARGLPHTQHRPTAWWLPMVDPPGHWFQRITEKTTLYTQGLLTEDV